jgi:tetratricopeptide (TPR) repeat protein
VLGRGSTGRPEVQAEILELEASLRVSQRRFRDAGELLDRVVELHRQSGDPHRVGRTLLKKAKALEEAGAVDEAVELLHRAAPLLDPRREPRLGAYARHNLLCCLVAAERFGEARELLPEVRALLHDAPEVDRVRLSWAEARIAHGLGERETAETLYLRVRDELAAFHLTLDVALASLDLAMLYLEAERPEDLERVAAQMVPLFHSRDLHREAIVALVLFQRAVEQRTLTLELLREMTALLRRRRWS